MSSVAADTAKGRVLHRLIGSGIALFTAHTNADVPADGVNEALARAVAYRLGKGSVGVLVDDQAFALRTPRRAAWPATP